MTWINRLSNHDIRDIFAATILFVLSFPPGPFGFLIYIALIPLLTLFSRNTPRSSMQKGYIIGILINLISFYWIAPYSILNFGVLVLLSAIQFALFGLIHSYFSGFNRMYGLLLFPFVWTGLEYSRQFGDLALNWLNIAYTQTYYLPLIQIADITGYLGITFWICCVNMLLYQAWLKRDNFRKTGILVSIIVVGFGLLILYGSVKLNSERFSYGLNIAYVQPNFETRRTWNKQIVDRNIDTLLALNVELSDYKPDIIIWPETSVPYMIRKDSSLLAKIKSHLDKFEYNLMFGAQDFSVSDHDTLRHNSVIFLSENSDTLQSYHKMRLVPKEEGLPFRKLLSLILSENTLNKYLFPGGKAQIFTLSATPATISADQTEWYKITGENKSRKIGIGTLICYESIFPELAREYRNRDCQFLVVITNDAWFGYSAQPYQHMQVAVYRAIENRISIVQSANSGVSGFIDPYGRIYGHSEIFTRTSEVSVLPVTDNITCYAKIGDWPGILSLILVLFSYIYLRLRKR